LTMALKYRVSVHISTVCRTLARMNITHKKVSIDLYLRLAIDPSTSLPCWQLSKMAKERRMKDRYNHARNLAESVSLFQ